MKLRMLGIPSFVLVSASLLCGQVSQRKPEFYFGGKRLYAGMPKLKALAALSECCELSPSADKELTNPRPGEWLLGHMILTKETSSSPQRVLGNIFFSGGLVQRVTRPLAENVDTSNEDLVSFVRALTRSLPEGKALVVVSLRHQRLSNAEADIVSLVFPNGKAIEIQVGTLDSPPRDSDKRDFVAFEEQLIAR